jgi:glyoxylase-like metal-dependent hydrolase (beta-lactamase superfamily II)
MADGRKVFPNAQIRLSSEEHAFWLDKDNLVKFPERQANFDLAGKTLTVYGSAVSVFEFGSELVPGLTTVDARGHTAGHTAYLLDIGEEKIFFWGDLIHAAALQFPRPDLSPRYDMNPVAAAETRLKFLEQVTRDGLIVAGAHLPFPGLGRVTAAPTDKTPSFVFTPWEK